MKAAILYGAKDIRVGEAPTPSIGPDEVLVESKAEKVGVGFRAQGLPSFGL